MKKFQWLAVTAGMVALAGCDDRDEVNMTNVEVNAADENLVLPPADTNVDMNADINVDTNADNATDNATNNTADNTVNAY